MQTAKITNLRLVIVHLKSYDDFEINNVLYKYSRL